MNRRSRNGATSFEKEPKTWWMPIHPVVADERSSQSYRVRLRFRQVRSVGRIIADGGALISNQNMFCHKPAILLSCLIVFPSAACFRGEHTVVIKTEPSDARLTINGRPGWSSPCRVRFPYTMAFIPLPYPVYPEAMFSEARSDIQSSISVVIERDGFQTMTRSLEPQYHSSRGRHHHIGGKCECDIPRVLGKSEYGRGKTYEYTFRLKEDHIDLKEASRLLHVSPMTAFQWIQEVRFPVPVVPPENDRSAHGALWRREDIEAWRAESDRLRSLQPTESSNKP
jgi:hypothetical protein